MSTAGFREEADQVVFIAKEDIAVDYCGLVCLFESKMAQSEKIKSIAAHLRTFIPNSETIEASSSTRYLDNGPRGRYENVSLPEFRITLGRIGKEGED